MPRRVAAPLALLLLAALLAGCGSSSEDGTTAGGDAPQGAPGVTAPVGANARRCETLAADATALRATALDCAGARRLMYAWQRQRNCALPAGASRGGCRVGAYRCQAVRGDRGLAVSCARPGRSLAFIARRG